MKIGKLKKYPKLFTTKILIWYDFKNDINIASLATTTYKLYARDYVEIDFKNIDSY